MEKNTCTNCASQNSVNAKYCMHCGHELPKVVVAAAETAVPVKQSAGGGTSKFMGVFFGIVIAAVAYWGVQRIFFNTPELDKEMMAIAGELNKSCPVMIDSITRLDNAIALPNNTFQYNYTLVSMQKADIDTMQFKNYMEPNITIQIKTNPQMAYFRTNKVNMNYLYKDKSGEYLFLITIRPAMYQ